MAMAANLESLGKRDEALAAYQRLAADDPQGFTAPVAMISQVHILKEKGQVAPRHQGAVGRMLSGGLTGGWIAAAHQVFYPDFYGGAFASCPDSVDFSYHQIVDIYKDANAYFIDKGWMKVDRPNERRPDGNIKSMMKDENWYELVVGDKSRSGGQWDIWEATFSPVGPDGYPKRLWNKTTGAIDKTVAEYWMNTNCCTFCAATGRRSDRRSRTSSTCTWATWIRIT